MPPNVERWSPGLIGGGDFGARGEGAQRESVGDALGGDQNVGIDAVVLDGEHLAGAGEAGLDFVGDEENAVLVENFLYFFEVVWRRDDDAAFAHDRLGDECGHVAGSGEADDVVDGLGALASAFFGIVAAIANDRRRVRAQRPRRERRGRRVSCVPCCR